MVTIVVAVVLEIFWVLIVIFVFGRSISRVLFEVVSKYAKYNAAIKDILTSTHRT